MIDTSTLIPNLKSTIKKANILYRVGNPIDIESLPKEIQELLGETSGELSDKNYDLLVDKLLELDPKNKVFESGIIEDSNDFAHSERKQKLDKPMYSLNKETNVADLKKWAKNKGLSPDILLVITAKYDGVSILRNEKTVKSFSRGDGIEGQNITEHYKEINPTAQKQFKLIKIKNNKSENVEFYTIGELIIPKKVFEANKDSFIRDNGETYKNPRNMVAGLVNNDEVSPYWNFVDHVRYGVADEDGEYNKSEQLELIYRETGFKTPFEFASLSELTTEKLDELYYKWGEKYEIDGLVVDVEDKNIRKSLGRETNNNPAYSRAYKANWVTPIQTTVIFNDWNVSKEGYVKPIVNVVPFDTEGVTISRATGYNAKFIKDNKIGVDSIVDIIRSGSVIPKIVDVTKSTQADIPTTCPSCGTELIWNKSGVEIMCVNPKCEIKNIKKIAFFFSSLSVDNFGEQIVAKFYKNGYDTVGKVLNMVASDISSMEGLGAVSANNILSQFDDKIKNAKFEKLGHASGCFENLGSRKLKMIVDGLGGMEKFENFKTRYLNSGITNELVNELDKIHGVSYITAISFMKGLDCFKDFLKDLNIEIKEEVKTESSVSFDGRVFVFSGVRDQELKELIMDNGGDVKTSVSRNTTDLIVKDASANTSKIVKARDLGVNIVQIDELKNSL